MKLALYAVTALALILTAVPSLAAPPGTLIAIDKVIDTPPGALALRNSLKNVDLGTLRPWSDIARRNSPGATFPGVPVLITQNPAAKIVDAG